MRAQPMFSQTTINSFFEKQLLPQQSNLFSKLLYGFVVVKCVYWLSYFGLLFGDHNMIFATTAGAGAFKDLAFILYHNSSPTLSLACIITVMLLGVINLITPKLKYFSDAILWFLILNLHHKTYATVTGGDYLLNQFLFFNIFLSPLILNFSGWKQQLQIFIHNAGVIAMVCQICLVYLVSGLAKLSDQDWLNGQALQFITALEHYRTFPLLDNAFVAAMLFTLNYLVITYQLLFPVLIWFRKLKMPLLAMGIIMHLYIAFGMGLLSFGVVMLISYIWFFPEVNIFPDRKFVNATKEDLAT